MTSAMSDATSAMSAIPDSKTAMSATSDTTSALPAMSESTSAMSAVSSCTSAVLTMKQEKGSSDSGEPGLNMTAAILHSTSASATEWEKDDSERAGSVDSSDNSAVDLGDLKEVLMLQSSKRAPHAADGYKEASQTMVAVEYMQVINKLGLDQYYPNGISLERATAIKTFNDKIESHDLPWKLLHNLLTLDHPSRDSLLSELLDLKQANDDDIGSFELKLDLRDEGETNLTLNPLDVLLATFSSCDGILQQVLSHKLFVCKLAIPFFYPQGSHDNIIMSLWALRSIVVEWWGKHTKALENPVTDGKLPIVTFVRFGKSSQSKSQLMNKVISDTTHSTFFNLDCKNSSGEKRISNGMVECSWFLPAGNEKDIFNEVTLFLNLRGDASTYGKQMHTLNNISAVIVAIANVQDLVKSQVFEKFLHTCKTAKKVVLLLTSTPGILSEKVKADWSKCATQIGQNNIKLVPAYKFPPRELITRLRKTLFKLLTRCSKITIEEASAIAELDGISLDESDPACMKGKQLAEKVNKHMNEKDMAEFRRYMLPLQGETWMKYSKFLREQHGADDRIRNKPNLINQLTHKMAVLRQTQLKSCNKLTPFCKEFLTCLMAVEEDEVRVYFLLWIKMRLDGYSRRHLSVLHREYQELGRHFQEAKKQHDETKITQLQADLDEAEHIIADADFGLEHLFRELGQIYEAVSESGSRVEREVRSSVECLPEIVARLLIRGNPMEIVDGRASNIPLKWIKAVMSKLQDVIGDKKLLVISVVGIQSSGKSTLLNTMFGLQFAVSAGRCTRGAFLHIISVDRADLHVSYIAVIDTEGLCAPELGQLQHNHDNELATLAIGLGDITLINIKGENTVEIKDILGISVHAFMRMKMVDKHMHMNQSCVFMHQNVSANNAGEKMMHGLQKLQEQLDTMTREAAAEENISNIFTFSQIIRFDVNEHVYFLSDLWQGDPPMAPANPGYSKKVQTVAVSLLEGITVAKGSFLTAPELSVRIKDLWNGVLADDFVFSFHNSLEMKAYNSLEKKYYELEWELQRNIVEWLQNTAEKKIDRCEKVDDLETRAHTMLKELSSVISTKAENIQASLKNFSETTEVSGLKKDIICQWQQAKSRALNLCAAQTENEGRTHLLATKEARYIELLHHDQNQKHEDKLMRNAAGLADKLQGKCATDCELKEQFVQTWIHIKAELTSTSDSTPITPMNELFEGILLKKFQNHRHILLEELQRYPLNDQTRPTALQSCIEVNDGDVSLKTIFAGEDLSSQDLLGKARHKTMSLTKSVIEEIEAHLQDLGKLNVKLQMYHAANVIRMLACQFEDFNDKESKHFPFTILPSYVIKLAVSVSQDCVTRFTKMQNEYEKTHGVAAKLESYEGGAFNLYRNLVHQNTEEIIAADLFCNTLRSIIKDTVARHIPTKVADIVISDFGMLKYHLILKMMDDLARRGKFEDYLSYISNAKAFALKWVTQYTDDKVFSKRENNENNEDNENNVSIFGQLTEIHVKKIIRCIVSSIGHAKNRAQEWTQAFCDQVEEEIAVPCSLLQQVRSRNINDFAHFRRILRRKLDVMETAIVHHFKGNTADTIKWEGQTPYKKILDKLWGCHEICPFCEEPCSQTTSDHYNTLRQYHSCVVHRPIGIRGWRYGEIAGQLLTDMCSYTITLRNEWYECQVCFKRHSCCEYKRCFPEWAIPPDSTKTTPIYWKWFVYTYQHQLESFHNNKFLDLPPEWHSVTKEDALNDLREYND